MSAKFSSNVLRNARAYRRNPANGRLQKSRMFFKKQARRCERRAGVMRLQEELRMAEQLTWWEAAGWWQYNPALDFEDDYWLEDQLEDRYRFDEPLFEQPEEPYNDYDDGYFDDLYNW